MEIDINKKIRELLHARRMTLKQLSQDTGISLMGLNDMLKRNDIKLSSLLKIIEFFNISIVDFFSEIKSKEVDNLKKQNQKYLEILENENRANEFYRSQQNMILDSVGLMLSDVNIICRSYNIDIEKEIHNKFYYKYLKKAIKNHLPNENEQSTD